MAMVEWRQLFEKGVGKKARTRIGKSPHLNPLPQRGEETAPKRIRGRHQRYTGLGSQKHSYRVAETAPYTTREQAATTPLASVGRETRYKNTFFPKRTQLKNAEVLWHE